MDPVSGLQHFTFKRKSPMISHYLQKNIGDFPASHAGLPNSNLVKSYVISSYIIYSINVALIIRG